MSTKESVLNEPRNPKKMCAFNSPQGERALSLAPCSNGATIFHIVVRNIAYPNFHPASWAKRWKNSGS